MSENRSANVSKKVQKLDFEWGIGQDCFVQYYVFERRMSRSKTLIRTNLGGYKNFVRNTIFEHGSLRSVNTVRTFYSKYLKWFGNGFSNVMF